MKSLKDSGKSSFDILRMKNSIESIVHLRGYRLSSVNALSVVDLPQFLWTTTKNALPFRHITSFHSR